MAATRANNALQALTLAALSLPGLMLGGQAVAEDDEIAFQYAHYQEGKRYLGNLPNHRDPIQVDSLFGRSRLSLSDRIKLTFNYSQDTWGGATPITTSPVVARGNRPIEVDQDGERIAVGASPYITGQVFLDQHFNPLNQHPTTRMADSVNPANIHVLSTASPETRRQGDLNLGYEWTESAVDVGFGGSVEPDYQAWFSTVNGRFDFNQKLTTLNVGFNLSGSDIAAALDHDAAPFINKGAFRHQIIRTLSEEIIHGGRTDFGPSIGLTQVMSKTALVNARLGFTHSAGYLENPYKTMAIIFADIDSLGADPLNPHGFLGDVRAFLEQRPDVRNQWQIAGRYVQHIGATDAALHLNYQYFHDDWDIQAHTVQLDWIQPITNTWVVTPKLRYYSQSAADFYQPYLLSKQAYNNVRFDPDTGDIHIIPFDRGQLPANFSSDHRLSAFGAFSAGLTANKRIAKGLAVEAGFEYYLHRGALRLGGGGEAPFADFDYFVANANLKANLSTLGRALADVGHAHHHGHHGHHGHGAVPAGVMFGHMMAAGQTMVGYRYMWGRQAGPMLGGTEAVADAAIIGQGCTAGHLGTCRVTPMEMNMGMHMLDLMYAPTDWLTLMLMPQFMDMYMNLRMLDGVGYNARQDHLHTHETGGVSDTGIYGLFKLLAAGRHRAHLALGVTAPTGDVDIRMRRVHQADKGLIHYGMQLGSGTWDFRPSLTYTGGDDAWSWGAQFSGAVRMEDANQSGYALGDMFQATAWGGYDLNRWLTASLRGVYTEQGQIVGSLRPIAGVVDGRRVDNVNPGTRSHPSVGPMDFPGSYGGRYWDVGFGLSGAIPSPRWAGHRLGVEWLQPVVDDVNGYQLERVGALSATWSLMF